MQIKLPKNCLVALIGCSASGKTTFAKKHFKSHQILSSDHFRLLVSDDENNQNATTDAFDTLYYLANKRLKNNLLTVIDATNVKYFARKNILDVAYNNNTPCIAIVFNIRKEVLKERNLIHRNINDRSYNNQLTELIKSVKDLEKEGFSKVYVFDTDEEVNQVTIEYEPFNHDKTDIKGPFDIIGDVHGCYQELEQLLIKLGYTFNDNLFTHKDNRIPIFLGDLCDRGPDNLKTLELVMNMVNNNKAYCVLGNHDHKLLRYLKGNKVEVTHGLELTASELNSINPTLKDKIIQFLYKLPYYLILDENKLVISHAGIKEEYFHKASNKVKTFCLFGDITGEVDDAGFPIRRNWAVEYGGRATIVYGHTPNLDPYILNNTFNIDTGCVFGGSLTAFSYPEYQLTKVEALKQYDIPAKPLISNNTILRFEDINKTMYLQTELCGVIKVDEENVISCLENMSRYSVDPKWLIYLPPTMSPCEVSGLKNYLEHPVEAFNYFKENEVSKVVIEKKHMGSRGIIIITKSVEVTKERFKIEEDTIGIIYSRTGKRFFEAEIEKEVLNRIHNALTESNFFDDFKTDFVVLDTEILPWSLKALELIKRQYAPVGCSSINGLTKAVNLLEQSNKSKKNSFSVSEQTSGQNFEIESILEKFKKRLESVKKYNISYQNYCVDNPTIDDIKIAPFHILATANCVHFDKDHVWHMETIRKYFDKKPMFIMTEYQVIDVFNDKDIEKGIRFFERITNSGGEGMVVKPLNYITTNSNGLVQPAIKCRGFEYLRIIYGPEYDLHLERLKKRSLRRKRSLALAEFCFGYESLKKFINNEPLSAIHKYVYALLALETEVVDPRL